MTKSHTRAVILAAGFGSRLMPHTEKKPKCMVEIAEKTILQRQTEVFKARNIEDIAIVTGHASTAVPRDGYRIYENPEYATTNMVASLMKARDWIENGHGDVIISYGDIVFNSGVLDVLIQDSDSDAYVVSDNKWKKYWEMRMDNPLDDAETFRLDKNGFVTELGKKPKIPAEVQGQYIGLQRWSSNALAKIFAIYDSLDRNITYDGQSFDQMYMTSFIQTLINTGLLVKAVPIENGWLELDTVDDYKLYQDLINKNTMDDLYDINEF